MRLFHISESPNIDAFFPRPAKKTSWPSLTEKYVWAISDEMIANYYFPRDCPRVCWRVGKKTNYEELTTFRLAGDQRALIAIEEKWKHKLIQTTIYRYEFYPDHFYSIDENAGYYISQSIEYPIEKVEISGPIDMLYAEGVKLIILPDLTEIANIITNSTYRYSIIRLKK